MVARSWRWLSVVVAGLAGFLLIAYVVLKLGPDWFAETKNLDANGRADARQGVRTASLALLAGAIAVIGAVYTARTFTLNRAGQLTDRFTKAIEQLGHLEVDVRLGGIYALERIARDSREDHPQVVEVLTAYVREHAPRRETPSSDPGAQESQMEGTPQIADVPAGTASTRLETDVQAVFTVLGRRTLAHEEDRRVLDLSWTHLRRAKLSGAPLSGAKLTGAYLSGADLSEADISGADLYGANLHGANLLGANLGGARLPSADLSEAYLGGANLSEAYLHGANLHGANLREANLNGANLTGANLNGAGYDGHTTWPKDFDPNAAGARELHSQ